MTNVIQFVLYTFDQILYYMQSKISNLKLCVHVYEYLIKCVKNIL